MILIVSDIHGNADALRAILKDAQSRYVIKKIGVLGDMFTLGPSPVAVFEEIENFGDYFFIRGNHEDYLIDKVHEAKNPKIGNFSEGSELYQRIQTSLRRTYHALGEARVQRFNQKCVDEIELEISGINHYFCHGTPASNAIGIWNPEIEHHLKKINEGCFWAGHIHHQMYNELGAIKFINPGGSGLPFDGDHRAPYAVIDQYGHPKMHRAPYDYQNVIHQLNQFPEDLFAPILQSHLESAKLVKHPIFE